VDAATLAQLLRADLLPEAWIAPLEVRQTSQVLGLSSGGCCVVCPGGLLVAAGVGLQAAVEDADEAVGELAERSLVPDVPSA
jgi:hypothetical protein